MRMEKMTDGAMDDIALKRLICEIRREILDKRTHPLYNNGRSYVNVQDVEAIFKTRIDELDERIKKKLSEGVKKNA